MPYNINLTNGSLLVTVQDGTADFSSSSISLFGKNYAGYGELLNENQVKLLENFSNATAPIAAVQGQLWWDAATKQMKVRNGSLWKVISSPTASASAPAALTEIGEEWYDTTTNQLKVYNGSAWQVVGPAHTAAQGQSGAIVETLTLADTSTRDVIKLVSNGAITAVLSNYTEFAYTGYAGLTTIKPGINLPATGSLQFVGTATNSQQLNGIAAADYARKDQNETFAGTVHVNNNTGLTVGINNAFTAQVSGNNVALSNSVTNGNITVSVNAGGSPTNAISIAGGTGLVTVVANPVTALGVATKQYVDSEIVTAGTSYLNADGSVSLDGNIVPTLTEISNLGAPSNIFNHTYSKNITCDTLNVDIVMTPRLVTPTVDGHMLPVSNLVFDIGGPSNQFRTVYCETLVASGADLAEKYTADATYEPGTVLEFGGEAELTVSTVDGSTKVAGVVSSFPATVMNQLCSGTVAVLALVGRVPVKVQGEVKKGDMLVSAGNGRARSESNPAVGSVIGKSLADFTGIIGVVEVLVSGC